MNVKNVVIEIADSLFIMVLCFGTLLTAMLLNRGASDSLNYGLHFGTFAITLLGFIVCLTFIVRNSERGLKKMIERFYPNHDSVPTEDRS
jgi:hypothetical protein